MTRIKALVWVLAFSLLPLAPGCSCTTEKRIEDDEPDNIREERRMKHQKLAPDGGRPGDSGTVK
jgi:hypothetical protein